jgi:Amino acid permease
MTIDEGRPPDAAGTVGAVTGATTTTEAGTATADRHRLHQLGYAQELDRSMSGFSNFAVSFTIISILSGCLTLYGFGMNTGGPAVIVWGWPFVGMMTLFVGLAMAEVCSSYPTAGGLYYWSAKLAPRNGPAWSWFTGWFNFLGQVAVTAGIERELPARALAAGAVEPAHRHHRRGLGGVHHRAVHAAAGEPDHPQHVQLHAGGGAGGAGLRRDLVAAVGPSLVQGPEGPGHGGGAGRHRSRPRVGVT